MTKKSRFDDLSREELQSFLEQKEQIREIVGKIGGKPTTIGKVTNIAMLTAILITLFAAPFLPEHLELPAVEVGLVLLSIKLFIFLHQEAKVIHFQFWMLSSLEWRMNFISNKLTSLEKKLDPVIEEKEGAGNE